jgi:hypothetical protein
MTIDLSINDDILNPDNYSMITVEMFTHRIIEIYSHHSKTFYITFIKATPLLVNNMFNMTQFYSFERAFRLFSRFNVLQSSDDAF